MGVSASSAAGSCGYSQAASSVRIRVYPWLLPRGAIQQRVHLCPFVVTDRKLDFQGGGPGGDFFRENAGEDQGAGSGTDGVYHRSEGDDGADEDGEGRVSVRPRQNEKRTRGHRWTGRADQPLITSTVTFTNRAKLWATASRGRVEFDLFDEWRRN